MKASGAIKPSLGRLAGKVVKSGASKVKSAVKSAALKVATRAGRSVGNLSHGLNPTKAAVAAVKGTRKKGASAARKAAINSLNQTGKLNLQLAAGKAIKQSSRIKKAAIGAGVGAAAVGGKAAYDKSRSSNSKVPPGFKMVFGKIKRLTGRK